MKIGQVNIGLSIEQKLNELGISKSEFGRKIGIPQQNVNRILCKSSIDTDKLVKISEALGYNFFTEYEDQSSSQPALVSLSGSHNQVNGDGAQGNINGAGIDVAVLEERIKAMQQLLDEKERLIKVYERMMGGEK